MKKTETLTIKVGDVRFVRVGTHRDSAWPYINIEDSLGKVIAMPMNKDLRKLRKMINYVLKERRKARK